MSDDWNLSGRPDPNAPVFPGSRDAPAWKEPAPAPDVRPPRRAPALLRFWPRIVLALAVLGAVGLGLVTGVPREPEPVETASGGSVIVARTPVAGEGSTIQDICASHGLPRDLCDLSERCVSSGDHARWAPLILRAPDGTCPSGSESGG
ncbi:hypothetical protein [Brevundimonas sp.]|uniref:hypothetical protein n=1 Tax=Brevundimonas sp. TaxID=1871086 RepID=UPI0025E67DD0|nr:hypothetical protein [Brevundimonas sp.]